MRNSDYVILALVLVLPFAYRFVRKWIVAPLQLYRTQTLTMSSGLQCATPEHITPELRELLRTILPQFQAEGFTAAANLQHQNAVPDARAVEIFLVNRQTSDIAVIVAAWSSKSRARVFSVQSLFEDDTSISTGVSRIISGVPKDPTENACNFPRVNDAHTLCEAHRRRLRHLNRSDSPRSAPDLGDELNYANREWQRACARYIKTGYRRADLAAGLYRYTLKGAFLSSWKQTRPIQTWRIAARDRRARREWKLLGMDQWSPPASAAALPLHSASNADTDDKLQYQVTLNDGEIREDVTGDVVTIRMGTPTVAQFLAHNLPSILLAGGAILLLAFSFQFHLGFKLLAQKTRVPLPRPLLGGPFAIVLILVLLWLRRMIRAITLLRGTAIVSASPAGLIFKNAPDIKRHAGAIARDDLRGLIVVDPKRIFDESLRVLVAQEVGGQNQVLLYGHDLAKLTAIRNSLMCAMGIESEHAETAAPPGVT